MFLIKRLVLMLVMPLVLLVAADYGLRLYSQSVVGGEVQSALDLREKPSVSFGGWPFAPYIFSGDLPSATFTVDDLGANGFSLHEVVVELEDVRFPTGRLITGGGGTIRAAHGAGTAILTSEEASAALHRAGVAATVTFSEGRATARLGSIDADLDVELEGNTLVLTPATVSRLAARIELPTVVRGLRYTGVRLGDGQAVLTFRIQKVSFVIPPS